MLSALFSKYFVFVTYCKIPFSDTQNIVVMLTSFKVAFIVEKCIQSADRMGDHSIASDHCSTEALNSKFIINENTEPLHTKEPTYEIWVNCILNGLVIRIW